jgi:hypothetical protein
VTELLDNVQQLRSARPVQTDHQAQGGLLQETTAAIHFGELKAFLDQAIHQLASLQARGDQDHQLIHRLLDSVRFGQDYSPGSKNTRIKAPMLSRARWLNESHAGDQTLLNIPGERRDVN